jgi:shikimate kinase
LFFLYGPPAAGKLTVARALAARTGAAVFHNHVSLDYALQLFDRDAPEFGAFVEKLRLETFAFCASHHRDLIFTFVYAHHSDEAIVRRTITAVRAFEGAEIVFVHLTCAPDELLRRVVLPSRDEFQKISDPAVLEGLHKRYDLFSKIPFVDSLSFDTTHASPDEVVDAILESIKEDRS